MSCVTHLLIFPEFPTASYVLGVPEVTLNAVRGTTTLEVYAPPVHFWQSVQWQSAVTAGSPWYSSMRCVGTFSFFHTDKWKEEVAEYI